MRITDLVVKKMYDTEDPVVGAVFEKAVNTDIVEFDIFMKAVFPGCQGTTDTDNDGVTCILYHGDDENRPSGHIGTFNYNEQIGYFGGSRVGSNNPFRDPGDPAVKNPFVYTGA